MGLNKEKFTRAGFEPTTSKLTDRRSTGSLPVLSISLLRGASQKSISLLKEHYRIGKNKNREDHRFT